MGQKQKTEKRERKKEDRKLVITMASYALQRLGWRTQSRLGQLETNSLVAAILMLLLKESIKVGL